MEFSEEVNVTETIHLPRDPLGVVQNYTTRNAVGLKQCVDRQRTFLKLFLSLLSSLKFVVFA